MSAEAMNIDTGTTEVLCSIRDRVATVTLNRPDARNALSDQLTPGLRRMVQMCAEDDRVGALLITGAGKAFWAARQLANQPATALGFIKDNLDEVGSADFLTSLDGEAARLISSMQSEDHAEAVAAFIAKREPRFIRN